MFETKSRLLVSWYMLISGIAWIFSIVILAYCVVAIVNEASVEIFPRRVSLVASLTSYSSASAAGGRVGPRPPLGFSNMVQI